MAIFTLQEVGEQIATFKQVLLTLAINQSYKRGKWEFVRADIEEIRKTLEFLDRERSKLVSGAGRCYRGSAIGGLTMLIH